MRFSLISIISLQLILQPLFLKADPVLNRRSGSPQQQLSKQTTEKIFFAANQFALSEFVKKASKFETIGEYLDRSQLSSMQGFKDFRAKYGVLKMPNFHTNKSGFEFLDNGRSIKIEPSLRLFALKINGKEILFDPNWDLNHTMSEINKTLGNVKVGLIDLIVPRANAAVPVMAVPVMAVVAALAFYEVVGGGSMWLLGCFVGLADKQEFQTIGAACVKKGNDAALTLMWAPVLAIAGLGLTIIGVGLGGWNLLKSIFQEGKLTCDKNNPGSFTISPVKSGALIPSESISFNAAEEMVVIQNNNSSSKTFRLIDLETKHTSDLQKLGEKKGAILEAITALRNGLKDQAKKCVKDPETTFVWNAGVIREVRKAAADPSPISGTN